MPSQVIGINPDQPTIYSPTTHFYDRQTRRYLIQFLRLFSKILVWIDYDEKTGTDLFKPVPLRFHGGTDRLVQSILTRNSENAIPSLPAMFASITGMTIDAERRYNPSYQETIQLRERAGSGDPVLDRPGRRLSIERLMPSPYGMQCKLDVITSNVDTKLQIWEQIAAIFNPMLEIASSDAPTDWGRLTQVIMTDVAWTSRAFPIVEEEYDVMSFTFTMPIWVTLPVRVSRQVLIAEVKNTFRQIGEDDDITTSALFHDYFGDSETLDVATYGPTRNDLTVDSQYITLGGEYTSGERHVWAELFEAWQQELVSDRSRIILRQHNENGVPIRDVVAWVSYVPDQPNKLAYRIDRDTLEENDFIVQAIVDPAKTPLPDLERGHYLIVGTDPQTAGWDWRNGEVQGMEHALVDDIVNYNGNGIYEIVFRARELPVAAEAPDTPNNRVAKRTETTQAKTEQYVFNGLNQSQFRWQPANAEEGGHWHSTVTGYYYPGQWKVMP